MAVIGSSERRQSGLLSFADLIRLSSSESRQPGSPSAVANVEVQIEISRLSSMSFVYLSPKGLGSESQLKWWARGSGFPMKISVNFIHVYLVKKSNFSPVWHALLSW